MIVFGWLPLFWRNARAKDGLVDAWKQGHAKLAVANTVRWLSEYGPWEPPQ